MTRDEVRQTLGERLAAIDIDLSLDGHEIQVKPADLGVTADTEATLDQVFANNGSLGSRIVSLFKPTEIPVAVTVDRQKAKRALEGLTAQAGTPAVEAVVQLNAAGDAFEVTPGQSGLSFDASRLIGVATQGLETLSSQELTLASTSIEPTTTTEKAQVVADAANALTALEVSIETKTSSVIPSAADKAAWVSIPSDGNGLGTPLMDPEKITAWVQSVGEQSNIAMETGVQAVNTAGTVLATVNEGKPGFTVNNVAAVTEGLLAAMKAGTSYSGSFTYDEVKVTFENRLVADGAENLIYPAAPGEKWLDLNLSTNTVTAYEGATVVNGPIYIVPGAPGMETPTGIYQIYLKYESQTMRGTNPDGTTYVAPDVQWVSYFVGGIAFHAAPWQSSFGWSGPGGSHGCVNMPTGSAQFVYQWAPIGTTVVSHY